MKGGWRIPAVDEGRAKRVWRCLGVALAVISLGPWSAPAAPAAATRTLSLSYDFARPVVELHEGQAQVTVSGCETLARVGEPSLPFRTARILLPPGFKVEKAAVHSPQPPVVLPGTWQSERGHRLASPWRPDERPAQTVTRGPAAPPPTLSNASHPIERAQLASVQRMLGCDIALVRLFPVIYRAANGQLLFSARLNVTLTLVPSGAKPASLSLARGQASARARVAAQVDNTGLLSEYQAAQAAKGPDAPPTHDYLLVTRASLAPSFQPLVERKTRDGLSVKVETMEAITASQPGRDAPEKLRNYIRYACTNWGVEYVLLGGDVATVPCRHAYVPRRLPERDCLVPCDLYFACLDGSWNRDGDARWGELTDGEEGGDVDLLAEVAVGRAPVDTPAEAADFVEKTVRYEQQGSGNAAEALLLATFLEQGSAQGGAMFDPLLPNLAGFSLRLLDDRPLTVPQWSAPDALRELNRGPHLVLYNGHGDADSVMRLSRRNLDALTNEDLFLFYSVGCNAGQFDNDQFSPDSIGEELVKRHRCGAFAAILNSRLGWFAAEEEWKYSGEFQIKLLDQLTRQGQTGLGRVCQFAKSEMLGQVETSGAMTYRLCYYGITFFGDPHLSFKLPHAKPRREGEA